LNDVSNLREAGAAITSAGGAFHAGLVYSPGRTGETDMLVEQARKLPELGASRVLIHDPSGSLEPHRADELVVALGEASGLPVGLYCQGAAGNTLAAALEGLGLGSGVNTEALWLASDLVDEHIGDEPVSPLAPRIGVRAAQHRLPAGLVAALDVHLRANAAGDRMEDVLDELQRIRGEAGWPPLAAPIGQILASQALLHVLSATRYVTVVDELRALLEGWYGTPPGPVDPTVRRAVGLLSDGVAEEPPLDLDHLRSEAAGLAASEEELLLLALFGEEAEPLLRSIRSRGRRDHPEGAGVERAETERIRELIRIVQESGIAEVTIEEGETRLTVRRTDEPSEAVAAAAAAAAAAAGTVLEPPLPEPATNDLIRVEAPMVGTFYRAPSPGAEPFVDVGDAVEPGQTLCILEAMKLMNEVKAEHEALVRRVCVENEQAVEYGTLLFELEPLNGRLLDAL
ncbi:MAG: acetyl-CoA carboxylase biotin carboxyl carrier protein, partial [Actinobacteria bacterium]|nr:acetyl-CoA carboxylase biotin carboxyl carrier protein [Actinomycetota bacterium]